MYGCCNFYWTGQIYKLIINFLNPTIFFQASKSIADLKCSAKCRHLQCTWRS